MQAASPNRLRALRTSKGISLAKLGVEIGVHESTISRWESGESGIPDHRKQQLAEYFHVSVPWLMGWTDGDGNDGLRSVA